MYHNYTVSHFYIALGKNDTQEGLVNREFKDLPDRMRRFVELYLVSHDKVDSLYKAGYRAGKNPREKGERKKARQQADEILRNKFVAEYIAMNDQPLVVAGKQIDVDSLIDRLYAIAMGAAAIRVVDKQGKEHYVQPSAKESTDAAKALLHEYHVREKHIPIVDRSKAMGDRIEQIMQRNKIYIEGPQEEEDEQEED